MLTAFVTPGVIGFSTSKLQNPATPVSASSGVSGKSSKISLVADRIHGVHVMLVAELDESRDMGLGSAWVCVWLMERMPNRTERFSGCELPNLI